MASSMLYSANIPLSVPRSLRVRASNTNDNVPMKKMGMSDEECEAAVVAGNIPEAPPAPSKPAAPAGTPVVPSLAECCCCDISEIMRKGDNAVDVRFKFMLSTIFDLADKMSVLFVIGVCAITSNSFGFLLSLI